MPIQETYGHELEGQTIIIETVPNQNGKRMPVGYAARVRLEKSGLIVQNVTQIDIAPIKPNELVKAIITLVHIVQYKDASKDEYEQVVCEDVRLNGLAAFVEEEHHE